MIDTTPKHLIIWGNLNDREKAQVVTKFVRENGVFDILNTDVEEFLKQKYGKRLNPKVITK